MSAVRAKVVHDLRDEIERRRARPSVIPADGVLFRKGRLSLGPCGLCGYTLYGWTHVLRVEVNGVVMLVCNRHDQEKRYELYP